MAFSFDEQFDSDREPASLWARFNELGIGGDTLCAVCNAIPRGVYRYERNVNIAFLSRVKNGTVPLGLLDAEYLN